MAHADSDRLSPSGPNCVAKLQLQASQDDAGADAVAKSEEEEEEEERPNGLFEISRCIPLTLCSLAP